MDGWREGTADSSQRHTQQKDLGQQPGLETREISKHRAWKKPHPTTVRERGQTGGQVLKEGSPASETIKAQHEAALSNLI